MQGAIAQLENALSIAKALQNATNTAQTHPADIDSQQQLKSALTQLTEAGIIAYAPEGIGLTSDENIQLSSGNSISLISENQTDITALQHITVASSEAVSLFAHKAGMKLFANQGKIEMQAQNSNMELAAKQDVKIDSVEGNITITASKEIVLINEGSYIKIDSNGIEFGSSGNVLIKANALQKMGPAQMSVIPKEFPLSELVLSKEQYHLNIKISDIAGINGINYNNSPWRIVSATSSDDALMTDKIFISGLTDNKGELILSLAESTSLIEEYNKRPGSLWIINDNIAHQLRLHAFEQEDKPKSNIQAAEAMGYNAKLLNDENLLFTFVEEDSSLKKNQLIKSIKR